MKLHKDQMKIKVFEAFAGYGSQAMALKRLQRDFPELKKYIPKKYHKELDLKLKLYNRKMKIIGGKK